MCERACLFVSACTYICKFVRVYVNIYICMYAGFETLLSATATHILMCSGKLYAANISEK